MDHAAITRAVREYNAAENSWRRAREELNALIPPETAVLHKAAGDSSADPVYWSYEVSSRPAPFAESAGRADQFEGRRAIIIEAPPRRAEHLPRLADG